MDWLTESQGPSPESEGGFAAFLDCGSPAFSALSVGSAPFCASGQEINGDLGSGCAGFCSWAFFSDMLCLSCRRFFSLEKETFVLIRFPQQEEKGREGGPGLPG